ncbi:unnamed protein product, partial [Ixodes pacificus]
LVSATYISFNRRKLHRNRQKALEVIMRWYKLPVDVNALSLLRNIFFACFFKNIFCILCAKHRSVTHTSVWFNKKKVAEKHFVLRTEYATHQAAENSAASCCLLDWRACPPLTSRH